MKPWIRPRRPPRTRPNDHGDDPGPRLLEAEAERDRDPDRLHHGHRVADEAEDGADRQVDVARHDDQHHARGHDADRRALDGQVPEVARRDEAAVRDDVEADPDDAQGEQHAQQPRVDPGRPQRGARCCAAASASETAALGQGGFCHPNPLLMRTPRAVGCSTGAGRTKSLTGQLADYGQPSTEPASTPWHRVSSSIQLGVEDDAQVVLRDRDGLEQDAGDGVAARRLEVGGACDRGRIAVLRTVRWRPRRWPCRARGRPSRRSRSACQARRG